MEISENAQPLQRDLKQQHPSSSLYKQDRAVSFGGCAKPRCPPAKQWKHRPLSSCNADEPDGWGEWGGAGIVTNFNPSVLSADKGHDQDVATPPPDNGADRQERVSTGGGPPGARVRRQHGQEYTQQGSGVNDHEEAPGIEPDNDLWGCLVHPPQLQRISHMEREHTKLPHVDIQGEPGGDSGVQQQQGTVQETWGESWWEVIVRAP